MKRSIILQMKFNNSNPNSCRKISKLVSWQQTWPPKRKENKNYKECLTSRTKERRSAPKNTILLSQSIMLFQARNPRLRHMIFAISPLDRVRLTVLLLVNLIHKSLLILITELILQGRYRHLDLLHMAY